MTDVRFIYVTIQDAERARDLARALVEQRLVACANILPVMESVYRWEGELRFDNESVVIFKTTAPLVAAAISEIEKRHSYDTPCALSFTIEEGSRKYLAWLENETRSAR